MIKVRGFSLLVALLITCSVASANPPTGGVDVDIQTVNGNEGNAYTGGETLRVSFGWTVTTTNPGYSIKVVTYWHNDSGLMGTPVTQFDNVGANDTEEEAALAETVAGSSLQYTAYCYLYYDSGGGNWILIDMASESFLFAPAP